MILLTRLVLTVALAGALSPDFNRQEPISLDLKDASVTDVITMLGALANAPVSIAPDVTGTVTIQVKDVPYAKVLEMIGAHNALSLRFEDGKLVATRVRAASVPAPKLDRASSGPRIPVQEYASASANPKPVFVRIRGNGGETCGRVVFEGGTSYEVPLPGSGEAAIVTQFGWDAVSRTRFLAVEVPGEEPSAFVLDEAGSLGSDSKREGGYAWWIGVRVSDGPCRDSVVPSRRDSRKTTRLKMRVDGKRDGKIETVMAPQLETPNGSSFSMLTGIPSESGQHDEVVLFGYVTVDGKSLVTALVGTAVRTDPKDGKEYVYSQLGPGKRIRFGPVPADEMQLATLPAGPVWQRPLDLSGSVVRNP